MSLTVRFAGTCCAGLLLLAVGPRLRADEKRVFSNDSDRPWRITLVDARKERGNLHFVLKGVDTVLGESGTTDTIELPSHSRFEVEFTRTHGTYNHFFMLADGKGGYAAFIADFPWHHRLLGASPVKLDLLDSNQTPISNNLEPQVVFNKPVDGNLTITASTLSAKHGERNDNYAFINRGEATWGFALASPPGFAPKGSMATSAVPSEPEQGGKPIPWLLPSSHLNVRFFPDASGTFDQVFTLANATLGSYTFEVRKVPKTATGATVEIKLLKGDTQHPQVFTEHFASDGYLEILDLEHDWELLPRD